MKVSQSEKVIFFCGSARRHGACHKHMTLSPSASFSWEGSVMPTRKWISAFSILGGTVLLMGFSLQTPPRQTDRRLRCCDRRTPAQRATAPRASQAAAIAPAHAAQGAAPARSRARKKTAQGIPSQQDAILRRGHPGRESQLLQARQRSLEDCAVLDG